jgi:hypothetical protein
MLRLECQHSMLDAPLHQRIAAGPTIFSSSFITPRDGSSGVILRCHTTKSRNVILPDFASARTALRVWSQGLVLRVEG